MALVLALGLVSDSPAAVRTPRFHADVSGAATGPGHHFYVGDGLNLRFRDNYRSSTGYRVCYSKGSGRRCLRGATGGHGRTSSIFIAAPGGVGTYTARWYVGGSQVANWSWFNDYGD